MTDRRARAEYLYRLRDEQLSREAERSLAAFIRQAWATCEPGTTFLDNWHIGAIADYLEAVTAGEMPRLLINCPPRYMKSLIVSVIWPAWVWATRPDTRWVFGSYSDLLAVKHSVDRRRLISSPWFQERWGHRVRLTSDQNAKAEFHNDQRGVMLATSVGGSVTGKGGNFLVLDDPHNPKQADSDLQREHALEFFRKTWSTRLDDKRHGVSVVVMQRLHFLDLSALCLELDYEHLCLPGMAESRTTILLPRSRQEIRREVGEPLWRSREDVAELAQQRATLGTHAFNAQYQQRPVPRAGVIIKREWWKFYDQLPELDVWGQSWDMSFKDKPGSDCVVGLVGGRRGAHFYFIARTKGPMAFSDTCRAIKTASSQYPRATRILIEDTANGPAIINHLKSEISGLIPVTPQGNKLARLVAAEPLVESGNVFLPNPIDPDTGRTRPEREWVHDFIEQLAMFPQGEHDDDVDAFSQFIIGFRESEPAFIGFMREQARKAEERQCKRCYHLATVGDWERRGGCPKCGSDGTVEPAPALSDPSAAIDLKPFLGFAPTKSQ